MHKHTHLYRFIRRNLQVLSLGAVCVITSFSVGIQSAGDPQVERSSAAELPSSGDMNGNGSLDVQDAIRILEVAEGYRQASAEELAADPTRDGELTVDDALRVLTEISSR